MDKDSDCTIVDPSVRLEDLKHWRICDKERRPFYLCLGESGGLVFNDNPEIVRQLIKIYNTQRLFFKIELVSFLNTEGIAARRVSVPVDYVLGYHTELLNN